MPIEGKFYTAQELRDILKVKKQRISNIANLQGWIALQPGLYCAESVEAYLLGKNISPIHLSIRTHDHPEGMTWAELEKEFDNNEG